MTHLLKRMLNGIRLAVSFSVVYWCKVGSMMSRSALILFVRKPEKGKVKTRIAATEGEDTALAIYTKLLEHTYTISSLLSMDKFVFYAGTVVEEDMWSQGYFKLLQAETDLGNRMKAAFHTLFQKGYERICIIGSDCLELTDTIIKEAFSALSQYDLVIGPAKDGGYYLLGMRHNLIDVFQNISWSTNQVLKQTLEQIKAQERTYFLLSTLSDIDTIQDVPEAWKKEWLLEKGKSSL